MSTENMVKAGKGGLTFASDWDSTIEYDRLTGVRDDNKLFFSKKPVPIGLIPEDGEYWFLAYEGLTDEQWEALLNGTQQVGDSAKLGGKEPSEYAEKTELNACTLPTYIGTTEEEIDAIYASLHENAVNDGWYRARVQHNVAHSVLGGGTFYVEGFRATVKFGVQETTVYKSATGVKKFVRSLANSVWGAWDSWLPLSGGEIAKASANPLYLHRTNGTNIWVGYKGNNEILGFLGFSGLNNPVFTMADGTIKQILHTGNKPSGTYTGNGSASGRDIDLGNPISKVFLLLSTKGVAFVTEKGVYKPDGSFFNSMVLLNGKFYFSTDNELVNANGETYYYFGL